MIQPLESPGNRRDAAGNSSRRSDMAITTGLVLWLKISADGSAEVRIGPSPARKKTLTVQMADADGAAAIAQKAGMLAALAQAFVAHDEVVATDAANDDVITAVASGPA
jgi:phage protein D